MHGMDGYRGFTVTELMAGTSVKEDDEGSATMDRCCACLCNVVVVVSVLAVSGLLICIFSIPYLYTPTSPVYSASSCFINGPGEHKNGIVGTLHVHTNLDVVPDPGEPVHIEHIKMTCDIFGLRDIYLYTDTVFGDHIVPIHSTTMPLSVVSVPIPFMPVPAVTYAANCRISYEAHVSGAWIIHHVTDELPVMSCRRYGDDEQ